MNEENMSEESLSEESLSEESLSEGAIAESVLSYIVRSIVNQPDLVVISVSDGQRGPRYEVQVGDGDMGRVIGRRGRTAEAIRTVVRAAAATEEQKIEVEFVD